MMRGTEESSRRYFLWQDKVHGCSPRGEMLSLLNAHDTFFDLSKTVGQGREINIHYIDQESPFTLLLFHGEVEETEICLAVGE